MTKIMLQSGLSATAQISLSYLPNLASSLVAYLKLTSMLNNTFCISRMTEMYYTNYTSFTLVLVFFKGSHVFPLNKFSFF